MTLTLTLASLVNAGGGLVFLLLGVAVLVIARRRALRLGFFAVTFGAAYIINNVLGLDSVALVLLHVGIFVLVIVTTILLILQLARPLGANDKRAIVILFAVATVVVAMIAVGTAQDQGLYARVAAAEHFPAPAAGGIVQLITLCGSAEAVFVLAAVAGLRARRAMQPGERRALLLFGVGMAVFNAVLTTFVLLYGYAGFGTSPFLGAAFLIQTLLIAATAAFFLPRRDEPEPNLHRAAFVTIVAAGLVGVAFDVAALSGASQDGDVGQFGVARTVAAALVAIAILRYDLLGVPLPAIAIRRGPLAAGALATLFIVAQVAQNFLAAQYGLLMGGVVAGAFLFAASPIQRAIERTRPPATTTHEVLASPSPRNEDSYRKALRLALRDRKLTRAEETHLHELARDLGIDGPRAHALLGEIERELEED